jgi:hypothetical protein
MMRVGTRTHVIRGLLRSQVIQLLRLLGQQLCLLRGMFTLCLQRTARELLSCGKKRGNAPRSLPQWSEAVPRRARIVPFP